MQHIEKNINVSLFQFVHPECEKDTLPYHKIIVNHFQDFLQAAFRQQL